MKTNNLKGTSVILVILLVFQDDDKKFQMQPDYLNHYFLQKRRFVKGQVLVQDRLDRIKCSKLPKNEQTKYVVEI